jgi:2-oxoglutarate dehydrogenase E2 component (dihydrolipoamide succinyltransferase)
MSVELKVPAVGESITEVFVNRWLKDEGDYAEKDETVAELETDKATFELPAPVSGTISRIAKRKGETAGVGEVIGQMEEGKADGRSKAPRKGEPAAAKNSSATHPKAPPSAPGKESQKTEPHIMPAARRVLHETGRRPEQVEATGPGGRMLKEDVMRVREAEPQAPPAAPASETAAPVLGREEEVVPMSPMRQTIARRLVEAQKSAALLTTFNECDMSAIMALRKKYQEQFTAEHETKLGFMSFFIKACVDALRRFPALNAEIRGDKIIYRNYFDIGIAVSTAKGLVVPIVRSAERLSFGEIEKIVLDFGQRGKTNKIELKELEGGTFTITNGGVFGSLLSTPIVNPPQSGVLGMHAIQERVVVVDGQMAIRPMMYLALTYDHRIVDGREAVTFLKRIKECIEDPNRMLMEV